MNGREKWKQFIESVLFPWAIATNHHQLGYFHDIYLFLDNSGVGRAMLSLRALWGHPLVVAILVGRHLGHILGDTTPISASAVTWSSPVYVSVSKGPSSYKDVIGLGPS